jgi:hypothetical protein
MSILQFTHKHEELICYIGLHQRQTAGFDLKKEYKIMGSDAAPEMYRNADLVHLHRITRKWVKRNEVSGTLNDIMNVRAIDLAYPFESFRIPHFFKASRQNPPSYLPCGNLGTDLQLSTPGRSIQPSKHQKDR